MTVRQFVSRPAVRRGVRWIGAGVAVLVGGTVWLAAADQLVRWLTLEITGCPVPWNADGAWIYGFIFMLSWIIAFVYLGVAIVSISRGWSSRDSRSRYTRVGWFGTGAVLLTVLYVLAQWQDVGPLCLLVHAPWFPTF